MAPAVPDRLARQTVRQLAAAAGGRADNLCAMNGAANHPGPRLDPPDHTGEQWVETWVCTPQPAGPDHLPPAPFTQDGRVLAGSTLRQTVRVSVGGQRLRLRFAHTFGTGDLPLTAAVACPAGGHAGVSAVAPGTARPVTFHQQRSVTVPAGATVVSDPLDFAVAAGANLTVTVYLPTGLSRSGVTSHPGSRTTSYAIAGDRLTQVELPGAIPVDHWYLLSGVQVPARPATAVAVCVGDSLTDGRGSTTNRNNRWPDQLFDRLQANPATADIAILNHGVGGSRLLDDGAETLAQLAQAVLMRNRARWLIVLKGVNDIGTAAATEAAQQRTAADLTAAYERIATEVGGAGIRVYGATLTPFGGHADYDDEPGHREAARQAVNEWIRTSGRFDAVIDADLAVRDPAHPRRLAPGYDDGDQLHLNPAGYAALAAAAPDHLFVSPAGLLPPVPGGEHPPAG